jgi:hypothetical protein
MGRPSPGRRTPVDQTHVVADLIVAKFLEGKTAATQARCMAPGEE